MNRIIALLLSFMIAGCAQQPARETKVDEKYVAGFSYRLKASQVADGMSEAQVVAIMGANPDSRSEANGPQGKFKSLGWSHYNRATGKMYVVSFQFINDKVDGRSEVGL